MDFAKFFALPLKPTFIGFKPHSTNDNHNRKILKINKPTNYHQSIGISFGNNSLVPFPHRHVGGIGKQLLYVAVRQQRKCAARSIWNVSCRLTSAGRQADRRLYEEVFLFSLLLPLSRTISASSRRRRGLLFYVIIFCPSIGRVAIVSEVLRVD